MCTTLKQVLILGEAFEQEGSGEKEGGGGRDTSICARILKILEGDKSDGCSKKTSLYITCLVFFINLKDLMLDGQKDNEVISAGW